jgi:hypothetical protein
MMFRVDREQTDGPLDLSRSAGHFKPIGCGAKFVEQCLRAPVDLSFPCQVRGVWRLCPQRPMCLPSHTNSIDHIHS